MFSYTDEIKITELADTETNQPKNYQGNGTTPPVNTQPFPLHYLQEVALVKPPSRPRVETEDVALQDRKGGPPNVCLIVFDYMLYGVYQHQVHQNSGDHLDGGLAEDI